MVEFIITAAPTNASQQKRALFFSQTIGRGRVYRSSLESPQKGFKLFSYKSAKNAQRLCDEINKKASDSFAVEQVSY